MLFKAEKVITGVRFWSTLECHHLDLILWTLRYVVCVLTTMRFQNLLGPRGAEGEVGGERLWERAWAPSGAPN